MNATFFLEIITPDKIVFQDQVEMVSVPSVTGTLGILPHHVPLFTKLEEGELKILKGNQEFYLSLGGGFMEIEKEKVTILVTKALHADEIDEEKVLKAKKDAEEALAKKPEGEALIATQAMLRQSLFDLKVLKRRRAPKVVS